MRRGSDFGIHKASEYLNKFGKCPGCRERLSASIYSGDYVDDTYLGVHCPTCGYFSFDKKSCLDMTQNAIIKKVTDDMYLAYQTRLAEKLME